ncbi:Receptor-Interacting Serine/Threonine-Protein Kinase 1 [Manis pentadactyla]|nr:Receptor-Interacting Serine/Threonine-Protein Kinase 1 [Manis pentadactyla]
MNPLSRNAAKRNAPRTRAGLVTRMPVPPGQAEHDARELSCLLKPLKKTKIGKSLHLNQANSHPSNTSHLSALAVEKWIIF